MTAAFLAQPTGALRAIPISGISTPAANVYRLVLDFVKPTPGRSRAQLAEFSPKSPSVPFRVVGPAFHCLPWTWWWVVIASDEGRSRLQPSSNSDGSGAHGPHTFRALSAANASTMR